MLLVVLFERSMIDPVEAGTWLGRSCMSGTCLQVVELSSHSHLISRPCSTLPLPPTVPVKCDAETLLTPKRSGSELSEVDHGVELVAVAWVSGRPAFGHTVTAASVKLTLRATASLPAPCLVRHPYFSCHPGAYQHGAYWSNAVTVEVLPRTEVCYSHPPRNSLLTLLGLMSHAHPTSTSSSNFQLILMMP